MHEPDAHTCASCYVRKVEAQVPQAGHLHVTQVNGGIAPRSTAWPPGLGRPSCFNTALNQCTTSLHRSCPSLALVSADMQHIQDNRKHKQANKFQVVSLHDASMLAPSYCSGTRQGHQILSLPIERMHARPKSSCHASAKLINRRPLYSVNGNSASVCHHTSGFCIFANGTGSTHWHAHFTRLPGWLAVPEVPDIIMHHRHLRFHFLV